MNHNDNITFYELVQEKKVKIPIIQRDYAQGRAENQEICRNFLKAIKESVIGGNAINLDFIYGNVKDDVFYPLDGQQRLTTLFLLHWYAYMKERQGDPLAEQCLKNFSYETRLSSRRFCEALVTNRILIKIGEKIRSEIEDSKWFFASWQQDSTIRAMLGAIDMIHELYQDIENLWEALTDKKRITFHLLILEDFGLSDDLYIKMNARGRLLTSFENLKAEIQDKAAKNHWAWEEELPREDRFSSKMDGAWTDFIWNHFRKQDSVDEAHMNFMTALVMFRVSIDLKLRGEKRAEVISRLNEDNSDRKLIDYFDEETFEYIYDCYELYSKLYLKTFLRGTDEISRATAEANAARGSAAVSVANAACESVTMASGVAVPDLAFDMWRHRPEKNLLHQILVGKETSYTHKVLFYAQTEYLLRNMDGENQNVDEEKFLDWMRVVRNIVSRANITPEGVRYDLVRSPEAFCGVMNLIGELAKGCDDIYHYLYANPINPSYAKEQMGEEVLKARIICEYPSYKQLLFDTEDNELLRGRILFALECAGYQSDIAEIDFVRLGQIQDVFAQYFNRDLEPNSEEFDLLRRAMLTIEVDGEYRFYEYWWSYWYAGDANKRKLFPVFREIENFIVSKEYGAYFAKLVNLLIKQDYQEVFDRFTKPEQMQNWQYRLIKEGDLLKNCKSKYIAIPDDETCCYLLKSKRTTDVEGSPKVW